MVLDLYLDWKEGDKVVRIAKKVMKIAGVSLPLKIYCGAFLCWDNANENVTKKLFPAWNQLWKDTGSGRELFQLCCAIKNNNIKVKGLLIDKEKIFSPNFPVTDCIVQHNYNSNGGKDFHKEFNLPRIRENKPFDTDPTDWNWVNFKGEENV